MPTQTRGGGHRHSEGHCDFCNGIPGLVASMPRLLSSSTLAYCYRFNGENLTSSELSSCNLVIEYVGAWLLVCVPLPWRDYGNSANNASNAYFSQIVVGFPGKTVPLSQIDEAAMDRMSGDEFEA
jgi:hypothetical protein